MEILLIIAAVYCIHLIDKWLDKRSAQKFYEEITGKKLDI